MTDATTLKPLRVSTEGTAGPYIVAPVTQLHDLKRILQKHKVHFQVEENVISLDGNPEIAIVNLGREANSAEVQDLLDSVR